MPSDDCLQPDRDSQPLPAAVRSKASISTNPVVAPIPAASPETVRILVIDDDVVSRALLRVVLRRMPGCEITEAVDAKTALEKLRNGPLPDLCITDFTMPETDGLQLLGQIRASPRWRDMEVILCTATADRNLVKKAASLRVAGYIVKPFEASKLIEQVRNILDRATAQKRHMLDSLRTRMGLENDACVKILNDLSLEIQSTIAQARLCLSDGKLQSIRLPMTTLCSACSFLSECDLYGAIRTVGFALQSDDLTTLVQGLDTMEAESGYIQSLANSMSRI